jgi:ribosome-associated heat shock protein Hsp15
MSVELPPGGESQRIDQWLWFARLFKTRSLATRSVQGGQVRVTRAGTTTRIEKPSFTLKAGDIITLRIQRKVRVLEVVGAGVRRGPAAEAQRLYRDLSLAEPQNGDNPQPPGRPSKRDRRALSALGQSPWPAGEDDETG